MVGRKLLPLVDIETGGSRPASTSSISTLASKALAASAKTSANKIEKVKKVVYSFGKIRYKKIEKTSAKILIYLSVLDGSDPFLINFLFSISGQ